MEIIPFGSIISSAACLIVILDKGFNLEGYGSDYLETGSLMVPPGIQMCMKTLYPSLTFTWIL